MSPLGITFHPGWHGVFTTREVEGAWANDTRIFKINSEREDANPDGSGGRILGSVTHPELGIAYFVEWDAIPRHAVLVVEAKVARASI